MPDSSVSIETSAWMNIHSQLAGCRKKFVENLRDTEAVQKTVLLQIIENNKNGLFGIKYNFESISSVEEYITTIPVHSYEQCKPYFDAMDEKKNSDLICFEKTGGSTQGSKLIPFTRKSLELFQKALNPWLDDLLCSRPAIKNGTAYWSISPDLREQEFTKGGHAIGIDNDALYFGKKIANEINQTLAVSVECAQIENISDWQYQTLKALLIAEDLSFISIWSPTFLLQLMDALPSNFDKLLDDIQQLNPQRTSVLKDCINNKNQQLDTSKIWPQLDTISCWTDGAASSFIPELLALFPKVNIQGKGLLATEGVVTIPLFDAIAPVLAIESGFYEFIDANGVIFLAHELVEGEVYTVLLSNESGLYRYNLADKVYMVGYYFNAPMLRFIGRGEHCSDLCGEKLTDDFVIQALAKLQNIGNVCFIHPLKTSKQAHYVVVTEHNSESLSIQQLENSLCDNSQYQYARSISQLGALKHVVIKDALKRYLDWSHRNGQSLGDIKPPSLVTNEQCIKALYQDVL